jgi:hypothetical protein
VRKEFCRLTNAEVQAVGQISADIHIRHLRGVRTILDHDELLREFAASTGQPASMHGLRFKLEHEYARPKSPHAICVVAGQDSTAPLTLDSLVGYVLLFEYRIASWNTGLFATGDSTGIGTVIAPVDIRGQVAALAASNILRNGHIVLTCFRNGSRDIPGVAFSPDVPGLWAAHVRPVQDRLCLAGTYDVTLENLGKRTRTHLRYYRRKLQTETGCVFIPEAARHILDSELASLNKKSLEPIDQRVFDLQFRAAAQLQGGYVCGLRAADGSWLSLAGGWRQGATSLLQWQMNTSGLRKLSLSTAFRAYLIEHEISLGMTELCFHGGTSHSIGHAFEQDYAVDLLLRRRGVLANLFVRLVPYFTERRHALANRGNFLIDALRGGKLHWTATSQPGTLPAIRAFD